jgi:hypothetical protein
MLKISIPNIAKMINRNKTTLYRMLENNVINYKLEPQKFNPTAIFERKKTKQSLAGKKYCRVKK